MGGHPAALDTPMTVKVVEGEVVILGPDAISVSLTPHAAEISGRRLIAAAIKVELDSGTAGSR